MIQVIALAALLQAYTVEKTAEAVVVSSDGKEALRYQTTKPAGSPLAVDGAGYFHPLTTPKGLVVTDVAPTIIAITGASSSPGWRCTGRKMPTSGAGASTPRRKTA